MSYALRPIIDPPEEVSGLPYEAFRRLNAEAGPAIRKNGYLYAKDNLAVFAWDGKSIGAVRMRWDLIPYYQARERDLPMADMVKEKHFSSYNARMEEIAETSSFKRPWARGQRVVAPVDAYIERADRPDALPEFKDKEVEILLDHTYYMAGIWERWQNSRGESLDSCSFITVDSAGNDKIEPWHLRVPLILHAGQVPEWLDPKTTPARAWEMCKALAAGHMQTRIVVREPSLPKDKPKKTPPKESDQTSLDFG